MGEIPEEMYYLPAITHALNQHRSSSAAITVQYTVVNDTPIGVLRLWNLKKIFLFVSESPNREPVLQKVLKVEVFDNSRNRGQRKMFLGCGKVTCQRLLTLRQICLIHMILWMMNV